MTRFYNIYRAKDKHQCEKKHKNNTEFYIQRQENFKQILNFENFKIRKILATL
jgi:hypothetical protein